MLQVLHKDEWGYICNDGWNDLNALVACRQLGYEYGTVLASTEHNTISNPYIKIWMDHVSCSGCEISISECTHKGWGVQDCDVSEVAAVSCFNISEPGMYLLNSFSKVMFNGK